MKELNVLPLSEQLKKLPLNELIRTFGSKGGTIIEDWGKLPPPSLGPRPTPKAKTKPKRSYVTPPQLAEEMGVSEDKVLGWIASGELKAFNAAQSSKGKRPRWRITREEIAKFQQDRMAQPPIPKPKRRRRSKTSKRKWV